MKFLFFKRLCAHCLLVEFAPTCKSFVGMVQSTWKPPPTKLASVAQGDNGASRKVTPDTKIEGVHQVCFDAGRPSTWNIKKRAPSHICFEWARGFPFKGASLARNTNIPPLLCSTSRWHVEHIKNTKQQNYKPCWKTLAFNIASLFSRTVVANSKRPETSFQCHAFSKPWPVPFDGDQHSIESMRRGLVNLGNCMEMW